MGTVFQGRNCVCGRRNYTDYNKCPHKLCLRRELMMGKINFMNDDIEIKSDIIDRLSAYADINNQLGTYTEANCAYDAIETINKLRYALREIGYDYVELSHDKVKYNYHAHMLCARNAYINSFPVPSIKKTQIDDNF